jgi:hypothetical protein
MTWSGRAYVVAQELISRNSSNTNSSCLSQSRTTRFDAKVAITGSTPAVWTLDLNYGYVLYDKQDRHFKYNFDLPSPPVTLRDFDPYIPGRADRFMQGPSIESIASIDSSAAPEYTIPEQLFDLVYRIVSDYEANWRAANLSIEEDSIMQLGMGILGCFTLNFRARFVTGSSHFQYKEDGDWVRIKAGEMTRWPAWPMTRVVPTISLDSNVYVIFTDDITLASELVDDHYFWANDIDHLQLRLPPQSSLDATSPIQTVRGIGPLEKPKAPNTYIITSITKLQIFKKTREVTLCTPVESFIDGQNAPSRTAVRSMLNAIHGHTYPLRTRINLLPVELQDLILDHTTDTLADGDINRAWYAAVLGIGTPFKWESGGSLLTRLELTQTRMYNPDLPEQLVEFWGKYVGITYQPSIDAAKCIQMIR